MLEIQEQLCLQKKAKSSLCYQEITDQMKILRKQELLKMVGKFIKHKLFKQFQEL